MCTTFLAYKIVNYLKKQKSEFLDFPRLIRFNPNIPWKTRGNGAVSLKIKTKNPSKIKNKIKKFVSKYSDTLNGANPGLVFYEQHDIPSSFTQFSELALWQLINREQAKTFAKKNNLEIFYIGNGQGLIGAIGAIGYKFQDHTFELLCYRKSSKFGTQRKISHQSVKAMQKRTFPYTFNSYDNKKSKVLIMPHSPDPVFYGVRGEKIDVLLNATKILETEEKLAGHLIFKSNQGTNDHLKNTFTKSTMKPFASGIVSGSVLDKPQITKGGHVFFSLDCNGEKINCAVYKETGITHVALGLIKEDKISVGGGIRKASKNFPRVLNIEFIEIISIKKQIIKSNPICNRCKKSMKSKGTKQGFQCVKCGSRSINKNNIEIPRKIEKKIYLPDVGAHRHLSRPLIRLGKLNKKSYFDESSSWFSIYKN